MTSVDRPHYEHPALTRFAPLAKGYCELVARHSELSREAFLQATQRALAGLYVAALSLPKTDVLFDAGDEGESDSDEPPEFVPDSDGRTLEEWRGMFRDLSAFLGPHDFYRKVFDPYDPPEKKEVMGSLTDDISDIYGDLRLGLRHWDRGESGEALWEWRFSFEFHWSRHLTGALGALNALALNHELEWPSASADAT